MRKFKKIFNSTLAKLISAVFIILIGLSVYFYPDFYKREYRKCKGYYLVYKGDKAFKKHDLGSAIYFYEEGIKLHPNHYRAMYNLANIYVAYEDYYSALKNYENALKIRPDYEVARIDYAIILSQTFKTDEAIEQYKKVIENEPNKFLKIPFLIDRKKSYNHNKGIAYYNMGIAYRTKSLLAGLDMKARTNYLKEAGESYNKATKILKSYNSNYNLGLIHHLLRNPSQAGYYYCKAIEASPMEYEAHFNLAILLKDMKKYSYSLEEFNKAGILLGIKGDGEKTKYIIDILSDVNQKMTFNKEEKEKEKEDIENYIRYKAGKVVLDDKKSTKEDEAFYNNFKTCEGKELFVGVN